VNRAARRVSSASRCWALAAGLSLAFSLPAVALAKPSDPKAIELGKRGNEQFKAGDYEGAKDTFEAAYAIEPDPAFLFGMGQALNQMGDCRGAIRKYNQVKDSPSAAQELRQLAEQGMLACAEKVANEEPDPSEPADEPTDETTDDEPVADVDDEPTELPPDTGPPPRKWYKDPLGDTLVAVGLAGTGAGVGLLVAAQLQQSKSSETYADFDERLDKIRTLRIAGGATLGVGGALLIGGVVRWMVLGLRPKASATAGLHRAPRMGLHYDGVNAGLSLSGRF
jgi:tetratricopeptide (TPR) repeat protein